MAKTISNVLVGVATIEIKYPIGGSYVEAGYTEDGISIEQTTDEALIEVEEETYPIDSVITREATLVTLNMAEASLYNIDKAIPGSVLAGSVLTIGGGVNKQMSIRVVGTNPAGFDRTYEFPLCVASGVVSLAHRKGEKTIVAVSFNVLKGAGDAFTVTDSTS